MLARRAALAGAVGLGLRRPAMAQADTRFFRIGSGGVAGTYYEVGSVIANAISNPPGSRPCDRGGSCGVPGLVAIVQSSDGSVANLLAILDGTLESGFAQADVAADAAAGIGPFAGRDGAGELRAIASLYVESLHVVVGIDSGIETVAGLRGRKVAIDGAGSGMAGIAGVLLRVAGIEDSALELRDMPAPDALDRLAAREIDAFILVAGVPSGLVQEAVEGDAGRLVPLTEALIEGLVRGNRHLLPDLIPFRSYGDLPAVATVGVPALWLVGADQPEDLVFAITASLFNPQSRELLADAHPRARDIRPANALDGLSVPLHKGAERWYREQGLLP